jgi:hypothetical protein
MPRPRAPFHSRPNSGRNGGLQPERSVPAAPLNHEAFYEQCLEGVIAAASAFPGHMGAEVLRPHSATAGEYRIELGRSWADQHAALPSQHTRGSPGLFDEASVGV